MDYFLIVIGSIIMILGLLGCIIPGLPGPPLSFIGLLLLHATSRYQFSARFIIVWAVITVVVTVLDYAIPAWGTKKFGGSRRGIVGSIAGLILGLLFLPPFGIVIGAFIGAVIGELTGGKDSVAALRSGFGSFIGFLAGTFLKLIASGMMMWYFIKELIV